MKRCPVCKHAMKHHRASGRCRRNCDCDMAALKANFKRQRDSLAAIRRKAEALER